MPYFKSVYFDWPLDENVIRRGSLAHTFGMVRRHANGQPKPHQGWDFFAPDGTPCYAAADGFVVFAGLRGSYGLTLVLAAKGLALYTAYSHLREIAVKEGDPVRVGQQVGYTGVSGNAAGMTGLDQHLHFELRDTPLPGLGLVGRRSPLEVYRHCPLRNPVLRETLRKQIEGR